MQGTVYEMVLDVSGHAHRTGAVLNPGPNATLDELYVWRYKNRHFVRALSLAKTRAKALRS